MPGQTFLGSFGAISSHIYWWSLSSLVSMWRGRCFSLCAFGPGTQWTWTLGEPVTPVVFASCHGMLNYLEVAETISSILHVGGPLYLHNCDLKNDFSSSVAYFLSRHHRELATIVSCWLLNSWTFWCCLNEFIDERSSGLLP